MSEPSSDGSADTESTPCVRIRGIYTTALTHRLEAAGCAVVQPSEPIRERFDTTFETAPADVRIETTRDRQGLEISGDRPSVRAIEEALADLALDTFLWRADTPREAVVEVDVVDAAGGRGATVALGDGRRGYLPYDAVEGYVDDGDEYRVQVREPTPPWSDDDPRVAPGVRVEGGLCSLERGAAGPSADFHGQRADELVGMTDLLSVEIPDGWGLRWHRGAADADLETMTEALAAARERAADLERAIGDEEDPHAVATPQTTTWCWFGRESRFELDASRRAVEPTMVGHHRIKAGSRSASAAVDFVEAVCEAPGDATGAADDGDDFPFAAVSRQFGPVDGDHLELGHGKPDGRLITLGRGEITDWGADGTVTLERSMRGGGTYDALDVPIEDGDIAVTKLKEGRWWYPTTYRSADGAVKGTYVNVCTPVELFPDCARYIDLHVDVIRHADATSEIVDEAELAAAVEDGLVSEALARKARAVAQAVERALSS